MRETGKSRTLGLRLKKDGSFFATKSVINSAQIANQSEYAVRMIRSAGNLMKQGYAAVSPYKDECRFCDYKCICDYGEAINEGEREVAGDVTADTVSDALEE